MTNHKIEVTEAQAKFIMDAIFRIELENYRTREDSTRWKVAINLKKKLEPMFKNRYQFNRGVNAKRETMGRNF